MPLSQRHFAQVHGSSKFSTDRLKSGPYVTANSHETRSPMILASSRILGVGLCISLTIDATILSHLCFGIETLICTEFSTNPKNVISRVGSNTDFCLFK